jgi:hypothetical protein
MKIAAADFFGGFFSALAALHPQVPVFRCGERFNEALEEAFRAFVQRSKKKGYEIGFSIKLHPLHGDSSVIEEGLVGGIRRDMISLANPNFERFSLNLSKEDADELLPSIPGSVDLYKQLARDFLDRYKDTPATT